MRNSLVAPVVLIGLGALFLANNLKPELSPWRILADYWPYLLIFWGGIRLAEIAWLAARQMPLPRRGISGGEWGLIVLITLVGSGIGFGFDARERIRTGRINFRGLELFGETFEFPVKSQATAGKVAKILVENRRGNVRLVGVEGDAIEVTGRTTIVAGGQTEADEINARLPIEVSVNGENVVIRTNHERAGTDRRVESDLEIRIPKGSSVECRGTRGDFEVKNITGNYEVVSDNAGVRGEDIGGSVKLDLNRSDIVRLVRVKGDVAVRGSRAEDIQLESIGGEAIVEGEFRGELDFRQIGQKVRFDSDRTHLLVERLKGRARFFDSEFEVENFGGPLKLRSRSKDVRISNFTGPVEVDLDRGDVELTPGTVNPGIIAARTSSGALTLHLPEKAKFDLEAVTVRGEVDNLYGSELEMRENDRGGQLRGNTGGARIRMETQRGRITVTRGGMSTSRSMDFELPPLAPDAPLAPKPPTLVEH